MVLKVTVGMQNGDVFKFDSLAEAIKCIRTAAGLSQEQAAELLEIKVQSWQKYEYGQRFPKDDMLERIAKALHADISVLTTFSGK